MADNSKQIVGIWNEAGQRYLPYHHRNLDETNAYELRAEEAPAIGDQLQAIVAQVQQALPNVLALTNKLATVLDHAADATSNLNLTIAADPAAGPEFRRHQRRLARAGRARRLGAGFQFLVPVGHRA